MEQNNQVIPVTSGRAEDANVWTRKVLDGIHVEMRVIDAVEPDLSTQLFGKAFASPIMMPAFSHLNQVGKDGRRPMEEYALAAAKMNLVNWVGMEDNDTFNAIMDTGADTIRIIKPFADHDRILAEIDEARDRNALAVGIDIDHIVGKNGHYDVVDGIPLGPVSREDLKIYAAYAGDTPFIVKGVLSVSDAEKAVQAGARGIVISHHHGRIPFGVAPAEVLPAVKEALAGSGVKIFADCSIDTGYDAYKMLALGADAVSTGRAILKPLMQEGTEGVMKQVKKMNEQLAELMMYTGIPDTSHFDPSVLHQ